MAVWDWIVMEPDESAAAALEAAGFSAMLSRLLVNRGILSADDARAFLGGGAPLHDPMLLKGMEQAVSRIREAICRGEKITVYGDYDVDGVTSTAVLLTSLRSLGADADYYIPDRETEGYGLNAAAVQALCEAGTKLIVTVDTGISAFDEAKRIRSLGTDLVITDHHEPRPELPEAVAIVNPKQPGDEYPCGCLAGVGVAFKLVCALEGDAQAAFAKYGALVTLGTVADVVPLTGENRAIVKQGLALMQHSPCCGLRHLLEAAGVKGTSCSAGQLGFTAAPRINAAGRLGSAADALCLLMEQNESLAAELARKLDGLNRERQEIESLILAEALDKIKSSGQQGPVLMVSGEGWHNGVIGIVASRLAERYGKPAIVTSFDGETGRASCRSFPGFDIHGALLQCAGLLDHFGGHALAAGFTVSRDNYAALCAAIQKIAGQSPMPVPELRLEYELTARELTLDAVWECKKLEPCGASNPEPLFYIRAAQVAAVTPLKEGRHLRLTLKLGGQSVKAILFNADKSAARIEAGDMIDLAASLDVNLYNGREYLSVIVRDTRVSVLFDEGRQIYRRQLSAAEAETVQELLDPAEKAPLSILPDRADFAAVYRFLLSKTDGRVDDQEMLARLPGPQDSTGFAKLLVILDVFREMGLLQYSPVDHGITFEINQNIKIDLDKSKLLRQISGNRS